MSLIGIWMRKSLIIYIYLDLNDMMLKEKIFKKIEFMCIDVFIFIKFDYKIIITKMQI